MREGEGLLDAFIITPEGKIFLWAIDVWLLSSLFHKDMHGDCGHCMHIRVTY